jgi:hypothetical protein
VIDTITSKAVLILGRFTDERKAVLDALREELRKRDYLPILFDFEKPRDRDTDETIKLLAGMARFVIADISAKSVLQELRAIVPDVPSLPVQPIILATQDDPGMFDHYRHMQWFLPVHRYVSQEQSRRTQGSGTSPYDTARETVSCPTTGSIHQPEGRAELGLAIAINRSGPATLAYRSIVFWNLGAVLCFSGKVNDPSSRTIVTEGIGDEISLTRSRFRACCNRAVRPRGGRRELDDLYHPGNRD